MGHVVIRNEQAVFVGGGIGVSCTIQRISVHRPHVGEGHIVQGAVCLGAAVKGAVHRSGNIHCRKVKIVSAAGGEGKLLVRLIFHRQRNVCEITCIIGIIITVALFIEYLQSIAALGKTGRNAKLNRTVCFREGGVAAAVIGRVAVIINEQSGNIFVCTGFRACVGYIYGAALGVGGNRRGGNSKVAAVAVLQRQLPFVSGVFGNFGQSSVGLSTHGGRCKKDRVQI